jgi:5-methylcytosine-specific restriction endonuclease McrA
MLFERIRGQRDGSLVKEARIHARHESGAMAGLLACLAVIDERQAFRALGFASIADFCRRDLKLSDEVAKKYLAAARTAREFPVVFDMLADRRLSVSAVLTLRPWFEPSSANELLAAASGRTREELEWLIAERFPQSDMLSLESAAKHESGASAPGHCGPLESSHSCGDVDPVSSSNATGSSPRLKPISSTHVTLTVTLSRATRDKLARAQELLGHEVSPGDLAGVIDRALDLIVVQLEKRRHGLHRRAQPHAAKPSLRARHLPADLRAKVYERDHGACTFVSDDGVHCSSRHALEYDHIVPLAQGGATTLDNLRLLCPAHNQLEAERRFGATFMALKRAGSRTAALQADERRASVARPHEDEVRGVLRTLGYARRELDIGLVAAAMLAPEASAEARVRAALHALSRGIGRKESHERCDLAAP